jgi:hypothetical protein
MALDSGHAAAMAPRPWLPLLSLLVQIGLVGAVACLVDASDLEQAPASWGFVFGFVVVTVVYAVWPVLAALVSALVAAAARTEVVVRRAAAVGAIVAALFGLVGIVAGTVLAAQARYESEVVFGLGMAAASIVPVAPLVRTLAHRGAGRGLTAARG